MTGEYLIGIGGKVNGVLGPEAVAACQYHLRQQVGALGFVSTTCVSGWVHRGDLSVPPASAGWVHWVLSVPPASAGGCFAVISRDAKILPLQAPTNNSRFAGVWNDTDIPIAHLITFRSYGTWLHGDDRGSIDRVHNRYKSPYILPSVLWRDHNIRELTHRPLILNAAQRQSVDGAVREVCDHRGWRLHTLNVRTNHVHIVVSIGEMKAGRALNAFKAYATRRMRRDGNWSEEHSPWADKGSKRSLWNERSLLLAIDYVINGQGGDLPEFD